MQSSLISKSSYLGFLFLHSSDLCLPLVFVKPIVQVIPPFEQHAIANKLEPRRECEATIFKHCSEVLL